MPDATQPQQASTQPAETPKTATPAVTPPAPAPTPPEANKAAVEAKEKADAARFAALAKKEKAILERHNAIKAREAEIEKRLEEAKAFEAIKGNPDAALKALGLTYEDLTKHYLNGGKPTPDLEVKKLRDEINSFKEEQKKAREAALKAEQDRLNAENQRVIEEFRNNAIEFVKSKGDDYELINSLGLQGQVYTTIESHFNETQKVLSVAEAASIVESQLVEMAEKAHASKKWASRQQKQAPSGPQKQNVGAPKSAESKTLTNALTASTSPKKASSLSEEERKQRAIEAFIKAQNS